MNFAKHDLALKLQQTLQDGFHNILKTNTPSLDDITNIYDYPIRLCLDLLSLYINHISDPSIQTKLKLIQRKFQRIDYKVLTSIEDYELLPFIHYIKEISPILL